MGIAQSALILLGIGIVSSRFKAGVGLGELGTGIQTLVAAPLTGTGTGLSAFAGGLRDVFETFGDLGRGLSSLFGAIPKLPGNGYVPPLNGNGQQLESFPIYAATRPLITDSGGSLASLLTGGGGNVPVIGPSPPPAIITQPVILPPLTTKPILISPVNPNLVML